MQGSANLNVMTRAARKAGRALLKDYGEVEALQAGLKVPADFTARAVRRAEEVLREGLMETRPNYGWTSAAGGTVEGKDPTRRWIVSPLDGEVNFMHGSPHWAVSVALEHKGEIVAGVVLDPVGAETFHAERGAGAWLGDNHRMRVAGRRRLSDGVFATVLPAGNTPYLPAALRDLGQLLPACAGVRAHGATALDLAGVAAGRVDGVWARGQAPWAIAAGLLLVREAGGLVEPIRASQSLLDDGHIVAGSGDLFEAFTKVVRERP